MLFRIDQQNYMFEKDESYVIRLGDDDEINCFEFDARFEHVLLVKNISSISVSIRLEEDIVEPVKRWFLLHYCGGQRQELFLFSRRRRPNST